jgi:putrescine transport system permease protein
MLKAYQRLWFAGLPLLWLLLFFALPFALVLKLSVSQSVIAIPPYEPLLSVDQDGWHWQGQRANFALLFQDAWYWQSLINSIKFALMVTGICLLIAFPLAYVIAKASPAKRSVLLALVVFPFWTSFLIRVYAWIGILKPGGYLDTLAYTLGLSEQGLHLLYTDTAVYIGMVYTYLPFMVLPIFASLDRIDRQLIEAARDLGCRAWHVFGRVIIPLAKPGITAGCLLVFIPAVGEFVIPDLLGGDDIQMIGKLLWTEFFRNRDWPLASALAMLLLALLLVPVLYLQRLTPQARTTR